MTRAWRRGLAGWVSATLAIALAGGCSSVPDITFANASTSSGGSSGGGSGQPPDPPPDWDCANNKPPPTSEGICCGPKICLRCAEEDCAKCDQSGCSGTVSSTCCKNKGNGNIMCRAHDGC